MKLRISIEGAQTADALVKVLDEVPAKAERGLRRAVARAALRVEGEAKESIQRGVKTGRLYRTYNKKKLHRASAPGEAPATDTGTLVSRLSHQISSGGLEAVVGSDVDYGSYLEFGTRGMAARPFLRPALKNNAAEFLQDVDEAIMEALQP